jgi:hypothetical protein
LLQFFVERIAVDTQSTGRLDLHAFALVEHLRNNFALDTIDNPTVDVLGVTAGFAQTEVH